MSVVQRGSIPRDLAMACGDAFDNARVSPFALTDFAARCRGDRILTRRKEKRLALLPPAGEEQFMRDRQVSAYGFRNPCRQRRRVLPRFLPSAQVLAAGAIP